MKLQRRLVEKPWGRTVLPCAFNTSGDRKIGEIWFEGAPAELPLLAKFIFTSERLSIQVHPDDAAARSRGHSSGKEECWYIVDAEENACVGIGLTRTVSKDELRSAALSGEVENLIDWRPVRSGDFIYVPAGTIHAIGPGVVLTEIQQNSDITYRLYDYGRPRDLHLDDAVSVACAAPFDPGQPRNISGLSDRRLVDGPKFCVQLCGEVMSGVPEGHPVLVLPLEGHVASHRDRAFIGDCLYADDRTELQASNDARMLVTWDALS